MGSTGTVAQKQDFLGASRAPPVLSLDPIINLLSYEATMAKICKGYSAVSWCHRTVQYCSPGEGGKKGVSFSNFRHHKGCPRVLSLLLSLSNDCNHTSSGLLLLDHDVWREPHCGRWRRGYQLLYPGPTSRVCHLGICLLEWILMALV